MKKFYMTMAAMLCGVAAMAQNTLYVKEISMKQGETVDLPVCLQNADKVASISFKIELPTGLTTAKRANQLTLNEERLDIDAARICADWEDADYSDLFSVAFSKNSVTVSADPNVGAAGYRDGEGVWHTTCFLGNDGPIVTLPLTAAADLEDGALTVTLKNIALANDEYKPQNIADTKEITFTVNVGTTGINSINADDVNAPIYNVAGQRVSKAQKGVFIQNGKKVAVK